MRSHCTHISGQPRHFHQWAAEALTSVGSGEEYLLTDVFVAVLVRGWWINVWKAADGGFPETDFAFKIPEVVVKQCCTTGI